MSERTYPLPSGDELSIEANESVWLRTGDLKGLISDSSLLIEVLALVDSLQQQVKELQEGNKAACESREIAVKSMRETCITSNMHYAKVVELVDQLAERDRTIDRLRKSLEATVIPFKFYADPNTYDPAHLDKLGYIIIDEDGGASAKAALAAVLRALGREDI
ncbi:hypothetical protein G9G63_10180 [Paenibacillus sp. EKM202P]|uniref:hypothetical protein n=1 Tax=unclassified Paenibacillus TaxID=185978 RepID=UPI0013ED8267|nr:MULTISPECIES: hypothetical protein [unclassified Paenibacillus]KAF6564501.1 hypothetical protein G9G63_10180 [Paenibacillus sp. EKM202P]KAF6571684.1 hypothetical protein G9G64_06595 [Paenibacillus sp. EKM207P]